MYYKILSVNIRKILFGIILKMLHVLLSELSNYALSINTFK